MKRFSLLMLVVILVLSSASAFAAPLIKVGIVNLPPEESGYRQANVEDMNAVFSRENGMTQNRPTPLTTASKWLRLEGISVMEWTSSDLGGKRIRMGWHPAVGKRAGVTVFLLTVH